MDLASAFNVPVEFKGPDGTVYKLRKPTIYEQGEYQRWLESRAHDAVDRSNASEEQKAHRHHLIDVDAGLGKYEWDGLLALESMWQPAGMAKLLTILCRDQKVDDKKAEEILATSARTIAAHVLTKAQADPKARADLALMLGAMGLPMDWMASAESGPSSDSSSTHPFPEPSPNSETAATASYFSSTTSSEAPTG
jgi:hypothetical protein